MPKHSPDRLFVYGTLRPGDVAWELLRPHVIGTPVATSVLGALYDTGRGYPALRTGTDVVPGWVVTLRSPADALVALDDYEGDQYTRARVVATDGLPCWTYLWTASMDGLRPIAGGGAD